MIGYFELDEPKGASLHPTRRELIDRIAASMDRIRRLGRARYRDDLAGFDMTMPQIRTLYFLSRGPQRMKDISDHRMRGMPSATSMIDRLVTKGYVERIPDPSDRRVVLCQITDAGQDVLDRFSRMGAIRFESVADSLTDEELNAVAPALDMLAGAMAEQTPSEPHDCGISEPRTPQCG